MPMLIGIIVCVFLIILRELEKSDTRRILDKAKDMSFINKELESIQRKRQSNRELSMTREEAKRRAELYSALAEGKAIQVQNPVTSKWEYLDINKIGEFMEELNYRIKPESKYRPFKSQEECWQEMLTHQPFGLVKEISCEMLYLINGISNESIVIMEDINSFKEAMNIYEFKDGTPFGIKEE